MATWAAAVGEELVCDSEPNNDRDGYTVMVMMNHLLLKYGLPLLSLLGSDHSFHLQTIVPGNNIPADHKSLEIRSHPRLEVMADKRQK